MFTNLQKMQASYGDALLLEYNETGTGDTVRLSYSGLCDVLTHWGLCFRSYKTYMLIDGGPGSTEPMYTTDVQARVRFTLNRLSGSTLASGMAPPANVMKKIDTLVLTHDDVGRRPQTRYTQNRSCYSFPLICSEYFHTGIGALFTSLYVSG